jgi:hypothetical protein
MIPSRRRAPDRAPERLHAMQFRAAQVVQVSDMCPAPRPSRSDRDCPLDTAGDRCLWHAGGTAGENNVLAPGGAGSEVACRVRPVLGDYRLVGKSSEGSRQMGWGLELQPSEEVRAATPACGRYDNMI